MNRSRGSRALGIVFGLLVFLLIAGLMGMAIFEFMQYRDLKNQKDASDAQVADARSQLADIKQQNENLRTQLVTVQTETIAQTQDRILKEVAAQVPNLPKNETPTMAQIAHKEQIVDQPFLKDAENGDFLIIYAKAKLSVLYRPSEHKVINTGPVEINTKQ